jgi:hypothetical protein
LRCIIVASGEEDDKKNSRIRTEFSHLAVGIGLFGYAVALVLAAFFSGYEGSPGARLAYWFTTAPAQNLGIPCAAVAAFAIVASLLKVFPPSSDEKGQLELKAFGLEFTGPSGPITLWLMCFLAFVFALKLLRT